MVALQNSLTCAESADSDTCLIVDDVIVSTVGIVTIFLVIRSEKGGVECLIISCHQDQIGSRTC